MLTENDVVDAVCGYLQNAGFQIRERASTAERGADIVATRDGEPELWIEAKGETSSKKKSARFGRPFTRSQVASHVARAFYTAAASLDSGRGKEKRHVGLALPVTPSHREFVERVSGACRCLGIGVFWVDGPDAVNLDGPWPI